MGKMINRLTCFLFVFFVIPILGCHEVQVKRNQEGLSSVHGTMPAKEDPILGLQSQQARGEQRVLILAVRFPDVEPGFPLERIRKKVVHDLSQHYIEKTKPPEGISSFTKIRLGWISPDQVLQVNPGSTQCAFLSPLSREGKTLAVKIPLKRKRSSSRGHFYLVENRQPIGYDIILPDHGLLILRVNLDSVEGSGTVKIMDADPKSPYFSHATFRLDRSGRDAFIDKENNVAIIPLWSDKENQGVLITTPEKGSDALAAARMIRKLIQRFPEPRGEKQEKFIEECIMFFKKFEFKTCCQIAERALKWVETKSRREATEVNPG